MRAETCSCYVILFNHILGNKVGLDYKFIQGVTGGTDQTSGECSLGQTIPI